MPGKNLAIASLICGIASVLFMWVTLISVGLGIAAIICAVNSKKQGYTGGMRTAGLILGIGGIVLAGLAFVACVFCIDAVGNATEEAINGINEFAESPEFDRMLDDIEQGIESGIERIEEIEIPEITVQQ